LLPLSPSAGLFLPLKPPDGAAVAVVMKPS